MTGFPFLDPALRRRLIRDSLIDRGLAIHMLLLLETGMTPSGASEFLRANHPDARHG